MNQQHKIMALAAAATFAYFYFVAKGKAAAQSVPGLSLPYNLGYNFAAAGTFSTSAPA
jgi:hypothetical protein